MFDGTFTSSLSLDDIAHVIQVALTPVFLLSGVAALLNVFSARLGRVADQVDRLAAKTEDGASRSVAHLSIQLKYLRRRSRALDVAVLLASLAGVATCGATLTLFIGALRDRATAGVLFGLFGLALACTLGALVAYLTEMLMASRGVRAEVAASKQEADASVETPAEALQSGDADASA
jgi:uncharacterized protein DUF2721